MIDIFHFVKTSPDKKNNAENFLKQKSFGTSNDNMTTMLKQCSFRDEMSTATTSKMSCTVVSFLPDESSHNCPNMSNHMDGGKNQDENSNDAILQLEHFFAIQHDDPYLISKEGFTSTKTRTFKDIVPLTSISIEKMLSTTVTTTVTTTKTLKKVKTSINLYREMASFDIDAFSIAINTMDEAENLNSNKKRINLRGSHINKCLPPKSFGDNENEWGYFVDTNAMVFERKYQRI